MRAPRPFKRRKPLIHQRIGDVEYVTVAGRVIIMDAEDIPLVENGNVCIAGGYVAVRAIHAQTRQYRSTYLARLILNAPAGMEVDHISGDVFDNRKSNLRLCTHTENMHNRRRTAGSQKPFKGIYYNNKCKRKWLAQIWFGGTQHYLGSFATPEEAADAYNAKAEEMFGRFARLNVIERPGETMSPVGAV